MAKYTNEEYLRAEHMLKDGKYLSFSSEIKDVLTEAPLTRKNKTYKGFALKFKRATKVLGLGLTNESLVQTVTGSASPDGWVGKVVRVEVRIIRGVGGGEEPAIRVMPPQGTKLRAGLLRQLGRPVEDADIPKIQAAKVTTESDS